MPAGVNSSVFQSTGGRKDVSVENGSSSHGPTDVSWLTCVNAASDRKRWKVFAVL